MRKRMSASAETCLSGLAVSVAALRRNLTFIPSFVDDLRARHEVGRQRQLLFFRVLVLPTHLSHSTRESSAPKATLGPACAQAASQSEAGRLGKSLPQVSGTDPADRSSDRCARGLPFGDKESNQHLARLCGRLRHTWRVPFCTNVTPARSSLSRSSSSFSPMLPEMTYPKSILSLVRMPGLLGSMCAANPGQRRSISE